MMKHVLRWLRNRGELGQTLAEFGLIFPLIALTIFGLTDMARAMQAYVTIQEAARDGARYAVTGRIDCTGPSIQNRANCIQQAVTDRTVHLDNHLTVTTAFRSWSYPAYADPPTQNDAGVQCDAVEVQVDYVYQPVTPIFSALVKNSITMTARERLVNEPFGTCS
jgi:Flp pilus assembly protein TadG